MTAPEAVAQVHLPPEHQPGMTQRNNSNNAGRGMASDVPPSNLL